MLNEEVRRIMTKDPVIVHPDDKISHIAYIMVQQKLQQIPVVEDKKLVGLITSYDIWRDERKSHEIEEKTVREVMITNVLVITPKDKVGTAAELFMDRRFKTLPVVNLRHELKGVITAFDIIRHTLKREYPRPILYSEVLNDD